MIKKLFSSIFLDKNNKQVSSNVIITLLIKGAAMIISFLIVPAYVSYFGNDAVYGSWTTVSTIFVWMNMFDFGIGNGLRNHLVKTLAANDTEGSKKYISSAYVSIGLISLVFGVVGTALIAFLDWNTLLKVPADVVGAGAFKFYIEVLYLAVVIHFFFLIISSISYAVQKTFLPGLTTMLTQLILLVFIYIPSGASVETKLINLSWMYMLAYNLPVLAVTVILFCGRLKKMRPSFGFFDRNAAKDVIGLGGMFFVIQIAFMALNSSDTVYINALYRPENVAEFNYYHKLFYVILSLLTLIEQPMWSAITKAYYEKRFNWIKKSWRVLCGLSAVAVFGCIVLAVFYQPLADIWLKKGTLYVEFVKVAAFVIITSETIIANMANCFANGLSRLKCQTALTVIGAIIKLPIAIGFAQLSDNWITVIYASIFAMIPLTVGQTIYSYVLVRKLPRQG